MLKILNFFGLAYWVEIMTQAPQCTYYFGPFSNKQEAESSYEGYIEDLQAEGAQEIQVVVKRCKPSNLTVFDEKEDSQKFQGMPRLSSQTF